MSLILPRPVTTPSADGEAYVLNRPYHTNVIPGHLLEVNAGFRFDGASIPRPFWLTTGTPMTPRYQAAALVHDALYASELLSRKDIDDLFRFCLRADGVGWYTANKMWLGVRLAGGFVWANHTPQSIAYARLYVRLIPNQ